MSIKFQTTQWCTSRLELDQTISLLWKTKDWSFFYSLRISFDPTLPQLSILQHSLRPAFNNSQNSLNSSLMIELKMLWIINRNNSLKYFFLLINMQVCGVQSFSACLCSLLLVCDFASDNNNGRKKFATNISWMNN
jgi:hypothetical protein